VPISPKWDAQCDDIPPPEGTDPPYSGMLCGMKVSSSAKVARVLTLTKRS